MTTELLPNGFADTLPPMAEAELRLVHHLLKNFMAFGYAPVIPAMMEFVQGESAGSFHVMDPASSKQLRLRDDMTPQIARIARGSMATAPRPLRLCYAGHSSKPLPEALQTRRQYTQAGIELFGVASMQAEAEVLAIACECLQQIGVPGITVDLHVPAAALALVQAYAPGDQSSIRTALANKNTRTLVTLGAKDVLTLVQASGDFAASIKTLSASAHKPLRAIATTCEFLQQALAEKGVQVMLTLDASELHGEGFYTGMAFSIFSTDWQLEMVRGGRYENASEPAVGCTFYLNDLLEKLPPLEAVTPQHVPASTSLADLRKLHAQGIQTVYDNQ